MWGPHAITQVQLKVKPSSRCFEMDPSTVWWITPGLKNTSPIVQNVPNCGRTEGFRQTTQSRPLTASTKWLLDFCDIVRRSFLSTPLSIQEFGDLHMFIFFLLARSNKNFLQEAVIGQICWDVGYQGSKISAPIFMPVFVQVPWWDPHPKCIPICVNNYDTQFMVV